MEMEIEIHPFYVNDSSWNDYKWSQKYYERTMFLTWCDNKRIYKILSTALDSVMENHRNKNNVSNLW